MTEERAGKIRSFSIDSSARSFRIVDGDARKLALAGLAVVLAVLGFIALFVVLVPPHRHADAALVEDVNSAKQLVQVLLAAEKLQALPDGRIDVYRTFFSDVELHEDYARILYHNRAGSGPTVDQIRAGDYGPFRWEVARVVDLQSGDGRIPVLWDSRRFGDRVVVAFSDGAVRALTEEEFQELRGTRIR